MRTPPRHLPRLPFAVASIYPISDGGHLLGTASVSFEIANGESVTIHGWRLIQSETGSRHISAPMERIPVESPDGIIERRFYPIVTYPKGWNQAMRAAILEAFDRNGGGLGWS